ncbi:MAG: DUF4350 domain-containing protein [Saprospiraceae bacterium]|nr:DUF4350 domain-containing protein [Saprospiraceae bacterium]
MQQKHVLALLLLLAAAALSAQQVPDTAFMYASPQGRYAAAKGPVVWLDEAHYNFHTLDGRYSAFGKVLRADGFQLQPNREPFSKERLAACDILVIANALDSASNSAWVLPNRSAFSPAEIAAVQAWVQNGGRLFLIADHMPFAGSAHDLAMAFGVDYLNGFAMDNRHRADERFFKSNKTLRNNAVTQGIDTVVTFTGSAFRLPKGAQPVLALQGYTILLPQTAWQFEETTPYVDSKGLYQLAILPYGKGKVAVSGEAAMFSAQLAGPNRNPVGMNQPEARQNAQLLLNILHWLAAK